MNDAEVVVVGAGIVGAVAARALADNHDVLVVDRSGVGGGATGRSAGVIAPTLFYGSMPGVARYANAFFRSFDGTGQFTFTERDRVDVVTEAEAADARETARRRADAGFPVDYLEASSVRERYPALSIEGFAGAVEYRDTGWVDPYTLATALVEDARQTGARVATDVTVTGVLADSGAISGVATIEGELRADRVVLAAGWRARGLLADHLEIPVRPFRTQVIVIEPTDPLGDSFPIARIASEHLYWRPEHDGALLVGGGAHLVDDPGACRADADEAFLTHVAAALPRLLADFEEAGLSADWAGVDGATPDARPIVDAPGDGPRGLVIATGFNGLGVMFAPAAGAAVRALVTGEPPPFRLDPFSLSRFEDRSATFELRSTSMV